LNLDPIPILIPDPKHCLRYKYKATFLTNFCTKYANKNFIRLKVKNKTLIIFFMFLITS
jgi:hypothetical protein